MNTRKTLAGALAASMLLSALPGVALAQDAAATDASTERSQETEADVIGLEYMAKAGFDPRAAVSLWKNMEEEAGGERPAEFASTHPSPDNRIESLVSQWVEVLPLYNQAHAEGRIPDCPTPQVILNRYEE